MQVKDGRITGATGAFAQAQQRASRPVATSGGYSPSPHRSPEFLEAARSTDAAVNARVRGFSREAQNVRNELKRALPRIEWEGQDRRAAIDEDHESRGMFNSGARLVSRAKSDRNTMADSSDLRQRASEAVQSLVAQAAEARFAGRADIANAALQAAGQLRSQASEQALAAIQQRNAMIAAQLRQLVGMYGSYG
jgi:phospholipase/lecithinase/hemolysin